MSYIELLISFSALAGAVLGMLLTARVMNKHIIQFTQNQYSTLMSIAAVVFAFVGYLIGIGIAGWIF